MRAMRGVWHWRHNPVRRRTDRTEAWIALTAALLIVFGAPSAGWFAGRAAHGALLEAVRQQHQERYPVRAATARTGSRTPAGPDPETSSQHAAHLRTAARRTGRDGRAQAAEIAAPRPVEPGERFRIRTDGRGRMAPRPMDEDAAATRAVPAGLVTAGAVGGLVEAVRRWAVRLLMVRRFRRWDAAWERAGQDWGRADAGS
ncbi:hypothetical protein GCM10010211_47840 [Streptomyces albospinus]|uniref:Uncharacterized protein n=1 Tax=Streptomyces albospinus TaxID=285515 RepID=A0ABQ2VCI3_9ACTN|nr:hypothetical protein [Streptomyces albospinus]GGU76270.1 hypothetical protein GCM10010211_47840 [Streptomyces albospinus]